MQIKEYKKNTINLALWQFYSIILWSLCYRKWPIFSPHCTYCQSVGCDMWCWLSLSCD